jgi:DNA-binding NarL/FixJ family response regulator
LLSQIEVITTAQEVGAKRVRVLIADDHPLIVAGIRRALEGHDDIEVVGEAHSASEVMQLIERRRPTVVLLDLCMPGVSGMECIDQIVRTWPDIKAIVLSAYDDRATIDAALDAGASAYVVKSAGSVDVAAVVRQTSSGGVYHAAGRACREPAGELEREHPSLLTERERAILRAVASGLTTAAISKQLWVSEHTVKFHLTNIYRKLGVSNRAGAIRYAIQHDMVAA